MDDYIRRQYTYRKVFPNPMLKVERVWKELKDGFAQTQTDESDDSDLGDVEEVEQQTIISYLELSIPQRLDVLHNLCEWQLHSEKFRERIGATTELQMSLWRIDSIGLDSEDQIYYFLGDGRLYRCTNPALVIDRQHQRNKASKKRKRESLEQNGSLEKPRDDWTCIASTYDQWVAIVDELRKPVTPQEADLLRYLEDEALPIVQDIEEQRKAKEAAAKAKAERLELERIKEIMRQEALSTRKRSSRIASMDEKREAERQRIELERKQQEMEAQAARQAEAEVKGQAINVHKTREARARERELREFRAEQASRATSELPDLSAEDPTTSRTPAIDFFSHEDFATTLTSKTNILVAATNGLILRDGGTDPTNASSSIVENVSALPQVTDATSANGLTIPRQESGIGAVQTDPIRDQAFKSISRPSDDARNDDLPQEIPLPASNATAYIEEHKSGLSGPHGLQPTSHVQSQQNHLLPEQIQHINGTSLSTEVQGTPTFSQPSKPVSVSAGVPVLPESTLLPSSERHTSQNSANATAAAGLPQKVSSQSGANVDVNMSNS